VATYPYISGQGPLVQMFAQLRRGFPPRVDAGYLKRFNIAPANESYVISILRFLGLIDEDGNRLEDKTGYFYGNDDSFKPGLEGALRSAYSQVFDEMGDGALDASRDDLIHWFRAADKTSALVGQRQASTFQTLAALSGHGELPVARGNAAKSSTTAGPVKKTAATFGHAAKRTTVGASPKEDDAEVSPSPGDGSSNGRSIRVSNGQEVGLTVRIEINLPSSGDASTYDAIFASIKKHLMS
jgi:hypothetical protein